MTAPAPGDVAGVVVLEADASDNDRVSGVQFRIDGQNLAEEDLQPPYEVSWNAAAEANGEHVISAIARDPAGNQGSSAPVAVSVRNIVGSGTIEVTVSSTGAGSDPDGYTVLVDGIQRGVLGASGTSVSEVPVGTHSVQLGGLAFLCATTGSAVLNVTVAQGAINPVAFTVHCEAVPSGQILFEYNDGQSHVALISPDGADPIPVLTNATEPGWSHDGARIAFVREHDVFLASVDGSGVTRLTSTPEWEGQLSWSPDDETLLYATQRGQISWDIYRMGADGSDRVPLFATVADRQGPTWSPDATRIAFCQRELTGESIWVANADGSGAVRLTSGGVDVSPAWSPDGSKIAYEHADDFDTQTEIYTVGVDGNDPVNLSKNQAYDFHPIWSPDGQWIAFSSERGEADAVWIMRADGEHSLRVSAPAEFPFAGPSSWR